MHHLKHILQKFKIFRGELFKIWKVKAYNVKLPKKWMLLLLGVTEFVKQSPRQSFAWQFPFQTGFTQQAAAQFSKNFRSV